MTTRPQTASGAISRPATASSGKLITMPIVVEYTDEERLDDVREVRNNARPIAVVVFLDVV